MEVRNDKLIVLATLFTPINTLFGYQFVK